MFLACSLLLTGSACSMHVIDIQQGTIITSEMVAQLKPGMTRSQVRFVMGTPTIADPFHADRWDYIYTLAKGANAVSERNHVALYFEGDQLVRIVDNMGPDAS
jgi:outer membrane protein assembly factor BamE